MSRLLFDFNVSKILAATIMTLVLSFLHEGFAYAQPGPSRGITVAILGSNVSVEIDDYYYHVYQIEADREIHIAVELFSSEFDPNLYILTPSKKKEIEYEISKNDVFSVQFDLKESGDWSIIVSSREKKSKGGFQLSTIPDLGLELICNNIDVGGHCKRISQDLKDTMKNLLR